MAITVSGYTTTYNCYEMEYPFEDCISSLLGFCDEVVVVDAGSNDGTIERLQAFAKVEQRFKFFVEAVDFDHPRWAIHQDGYLKAKARSKCLADFCWQTDTDEIVLQKDWGKVRALPSIMNEFSLLMLPMAEFWGGFDKIRADFFTWKHRFSKNDPNITHGIPKRVTLFDSQGHPYPKPFDSDSCNYIYKDSGEDVKVLIPLTVSFEQLGKMTEKEYEDYFYLCMANLPSVIHLSWLNLERKINHYKRFWQRFHASMYNLKLEDTATSNVMFDKPWSVVSAEDIKAKASLLKEIGPRSFHTKLDPTVKGKTFDWRGEIPNTIVCWNENLIKTKTKPNTSDEIISVSSNPLVSAIVPSYGKAPFLFESVGSVIAQEYKNIEIIIVDDGSLDNTKEVAHQIITTHTNCQISYLRKENGGISDARNYGITRARGTIIMALDGDDVADPAFIGKAYSRMKENGANLVCADVNIFGEKPGQWIPNEYNEYFIRYDNSISTLTLYEKWLWEKTGGYKKAFPFVEDWEFFINCSRHGLKVAQIREKLFSYRSSTGGLAALFTDSYKECLSLVSIANADLYPIEEILGAHDYIGDILKPTWKDRFLKQEAIHPGEWLLKFWLGVHAEKKGDINQANLRYGQAMQLTNFKEWQPIFRLGVLFFQSGQYREAAECLNMSRILRPDMSKIVRPLMDNVEKLVGNAA